MVKCDICKEREAYRKMEAHHDLEPEDCKVYLATKSMRFNICEDCEKWYCHPCNWTEFCSVHSVLTMDVVEVLK